MTRVAESLDRVSKEGILEKFQTRPGDTGSTDVQVAFLSRRIDEITDHLRAHRHDHHSRRGLFMLVGRRRRLLQYLSRDNVQRYRTLIAQLGLRK